MHMRVVSTNEFRDKLSEFLSSVAKDETSIVVKRFGKPIAVVSPFRKEEVYDFKKYFGFMKGKESGVEYENRIRRNKREREYVKALRRGQKLR